MQSNVVENSVNPNIIQQIPIVDSTQVLTQTTPIEVSQVNPISSVTASTPGLPNPQISISYAPIVSAIKPPETTGQVPVVKVIPIYD